MIQRSQFHQAHIQSNICSKYFALFVYQFIKVVNSKTKKGIDLDVGDVLDVNTQARGTGFEKVGPAKRTD